MKPTLPIDKNTIPEGYFERVDHESTARECRSIADKNPNVRDLAYTLADIWEGFADIHATVKDTLDRYGTKSSKA